MGVACSMVTDRRALANCEGTLLTASGTVSRDAPEEGTLLTASGTVSRDAPEDNDTKICRATETNWLTCSKGVNNKHCLYIIL